MLVGTKSDLRDDPATIQKMAAIKQRPITVEAAEQLALEINAVKYVECSALTQKGLRNVFEEALLAALEPPEPQKRGWFRVPKVSFPSFRRGESYCLIHMSQSYIEILLYICAYLQYLGGSEEKALQSSKEAKPLKQEVII